MKDSLNITKKLSTDTFILQIENKIIENSDIFKEKIKELKIFNDFFNDLGFILTDKSCEKLSILIHYIISEIPVLLEGPTDSSKTILAHAANEFISKLLINDYEYEDSLLILNLNEETEVDDLLIKFLGDNTFIEGNFFKAFTQGHILLLEDINLAKKKVIECIQQALDNKILSVEMPGKILRKYKMHKNFGVIATYNTDNNRFSKDIENLGISFLSRFQKMSLSSLSKEEITEIIKGKAKLKNYNLNEDILSDIIYFHFDLKKQLLYDENHYSSIRQIEALLDAICKGKNIYDSLMSIYFARYPKVLKSDLKRKLAIKN